MSLHRTLNGLLLACLLMNLCACSYFVGEDGIFRDRKKDYRKAESIPRMQVPEHLDDSAIVDLYPVPPISPYSDGEMIDEFFLPRGVVSRESAVRIQMMGDTRWILLQASASQVWPRLKEFLSAKNLLLTIENGAAGMMEARAADGFYRFRIEQGFQRNSSELSVRFVARVTEASAFWPERSSDLVREHAMIDEVSRFFAEVSDKPAYSFAAQGISTKKKIAIEHDEQGGKILVLMVDELRAWLTLEQSLKKAGFAIEEIDADNRNVRAQYVPPVPPADQPGAFKRFFGIKADPYDKNMKYAGERYQFHIQGDGDQSMLSVQALNNRQRSVADVRKEQNYILLLLQERLY